VSKVHAHGHAAHGADLHVDDDQVDLAALNTVADLVSCRYFLNKEVGSFEHRAKFVTQRREVAR
jgi:hypothetical protein